MNDHHPLVPAKSRRGDRRSFVLFCLFFLTLGLALEVDHRPGMRITMRAAEEREKCFFFFLLLLLLLVFFLVRATSMKAPGTPKKNEKRNQITKKQKKGTHRVTIWQRRRAVRSLSIAFLVLLEFFVVLFDIWFFFLSFSFYSACQRQTLLAARVLFFFVVVVPVETHENPIKNEATPKKTR